MADCPPRQTVRADAEIMLRGSFDPVDPASHLDHVRIQFQDAPLRQQRLHPDRVVRFQEQSHEPDRPIPIFPPWVSGESHRHRSGRRRELGTCDICFQAQLCSDSASVADRYRVDNYFNGIDRVANQSRGFQPASP
jgi:hypothetical protein